MLNPKASVPITLTASGSVESALSEVWSAIEASWPPFAGYPAIQPLTLDEASNMLAGALEPVILGVFQEGFDRTALYKFLAHIEELGVPAVLVFPELDEELACLGGHAVVVVDSRTEASQIAATLNAFACAHPLIASLRRDLLNAERVQSGANGEIERLHEEMCLAASVQSSFLPAELPVSDLLDISVLYRPASYVSGDIYDARWLSDHHIGFLVADAVGHGVPAALMTMVIARSVANNAHSREGLNAPSEVLRRLNMELIQRSGDQPRFATAVYGVIDTRDNMVTLAGAGHPPVYVFGPEGQRQYGSGGGLLGIFAEDSFDQHEFELSEGESIVIYTDGFETAFEENQEEGHIHQIKPNDQYIDQFGTLAVEAATTNLKEAMLRFGQQLEQQTGSLHQPDDLTAIIISARTMAQRKTLRKVA